MSIELSKGAKNMLTKENSAGQQQPYDKQTGEYKSFGGSFSSPKSSFNNANSGYVGYSMSVRAKEAYENNEKPKSQWSKDELVDAVLSFNSNVDEKMVKKLSVDYLRQNFLEMTSWHHTGKFFNRTDFYSINEDAIEQLTNEDITKHLDYVKSERAEKLAMKDKIAQKKKEDEILGNYIADVSYTEWEHKRPHEVKLEGVKVKEKGEFADWYEITDKNGNTFKKKRGNINVYNEKYTPQQKNIAQKRSDEDYEYHYGDEQLKQSQRIQYEEVERDKHWESEKEREIGLKWLKEQNEKWKPKKQLDKDYNHSASYYGKKYGVKSYYREAKPVQDKYFKSQSEHFWQKGKIFMIRGQPKKNDLRIYSDWNEYKTYMQVFNGKDWEKLNK